MFRPPVMQGRPHRMSPIFGPRPQLNLQALLRARLGLPMPEKTDVPPQLEGGPIHDDGSQYSGMDQGMGPGQVLEAGDMSNPAPPNPYGGQVAETGEAPQPMIPGFQNPVSGGMSPMQGMPQVPLAHARQNLIRMHLDAAVHRMRNHSAAHAMKNFRGQ